MYACMCADVVSEVYVGGVIMQLLTSRVWKMLLCFSCCWDVTRLSNSHLGDVKGEKNYIYPLMAVLVMHNTEYHLRFKGP